MIEDGDEIVSGDDQAPSQTIENRSMTVENGADDRVIVGSAPGIPAGLTISRANVGFRPIADVRYPA